MKSYVSFQHFITTFYTTILKTTLKRAMRNQHEESACFPSVLTFLKHFVETGRTHVGGGPMAKNGEKWRKMAMANSTFSFVKFAIFRQFLILEFCI